MPKLLAEDVLRSLREHVKSLLKLQHHVLISSDSYPASDKSTEQVSAQPLLLPSSYSLAPCPPIASLAAQSAVV